MATKDKRQDRFLQKNRHIQRQIKIAKTCGLKSVLEEPHRLHKKAAMDCGNPRCFVCGNTRKIFGDKTMQEQKFDMFCEVVE